MLNWRAQDILSATKGHTLHPQDSVAHGVSIDSRTVKQGDLFIAIKGDSCDGHDFVRAAMEAGAIAAIVERQPPQVPPDAPLIFVDNTMDALQDLGCAGRDRCEASIVAVTGSVGKTSTKEQLRLMLGSVGETYANEGSLNNHWGVPLSLARLPQDARYGVIEIGMNHAGELGPLSRFVRPQIALITNIEAVHLEHFESTEAIAQAKAEIFEGMDKSGIAILNRDNPHYTFLAAKAKESGLKKILSFGRDSKSDARLLAIKQDEHGLLIDAMMMGHPLTYRMEPMGEHLAFNALGALLVCAALGADYSLCAQALEAYRPSVRRGTRELLSMPDGKTLCVIDETFNASPVATHAALATLGKTPKPMPTGRRIAVLGDMRELGETGPALHADLADTILRSEIDLVYCCGELMKNLTNALPPDRRGGHRPDSTAMAELVASEVKSGDVVMVKGSKSVHMDYVVHALRALVNEHKIAS